MIKKIIICLCLCLTIKSYAKEIAHFEHFWEGNLALPTSQQPGALIALGQNIVDKNDFLLFFEWNQLKGKNLKNTTIDPSLLYGITDTSSLFIRIPIATSFRSNNQKSSGIGDITTQFEYAFFNKDTPSYGIQSTVVGNIGFPTGSFKKEPPTGFGSTSFFLGATLSYLSIDWYAFNSAGATLTTSHNGNKAGNEYLYQWGFGKNIAYRSKEWIFTWILEFDGTYSQSNTINQISIKNSGNNSLLGTLTLWFSTKKFTAISSISVPVIQHAFGQQNNKTHYFLELVLGWKFNG